MSVLDNVDDVHVLTGALKLFFRELKEPLIPWDAVEKLLNAVNLPGKAGKVRGLYLGPSCHTLGKCEG